MPFLLDTCSLSEFVVPKPNLAAKEKLTSLPRAELFISTITIGELEQGITELAEGNRKRFLRGWLDDHVLVLYAQRILAVDVAIARQWGMLNGRLRSEGHMMQVEDSLLAATALEFGLTIVTRNESDFLHSGVPVLNPWK